MRTLVLLCLPLLLLPSLAGAAEEPAAVSAAQLFEASGCRGCHRLAGRGGRLGSPLDGVGKRHDRERLRRQLLFARQANPQSAMPSYDHLSPAELELLLDYLVQLK